MKRKQITAMITAMTMVLGITACGSGNVSAEQENKEQTEIESTLNISNNDEITWSYDSQSDSWTMSVTCAVANPELPDYQGVSVNVPGAYVKGIDTNGDGKEDITGKTYSEEVNGRLVIDDRAKIANTNGQTYTASTAPVIINTGAAGYSAQENQKASSSNAAYGYINVACGNRGKQSTATDENGEEYYTGDAPLCLADQKNAIRFVKYNIILGNLPGNAQDDLVTSGMGDEVGTPDAGTTQSAGTKTDSSSYSSYEEMLESYESDIASIEDGDKYGNNIVDLYNPINYIGDEDTESPTWTRIVMGASEGDMSLFAFMNMQIAWINSGTDAKLEWQWDGGHVPSEIFGESLALYVDEMYGKYVEGAAEVTKAEAQLQTQNGTDTEATGTDISSWVSYEDGEVKFTLADAASYRSKGASKATPGFDVMDYGQETYEFGSLTQDARHFDKYVLKVLQEDAETLSELFNSEEK